MNFKSLLSTRDQVTKSQTKIRKKPGEVVLQFSLPNLAKVFSKSLFHLARFMASKQGLLSIVQTTSRLITFTGLLIVYQIHSGIPWRFMPDFIKNTWQPREKKFYARSIAILDRNSQFTISRVDLIDLAFRNMMSKKTRTIITVGGMALGVGAIVFLVSIGYGLQQLVISRVARLDEMRQADVYAQPNSSVKLNDKSLATLSQVPKVDAVLPLISAVGRVNYQNSISDVAVFGVTADYLKLSAIKTIRGEIFKSNDVSTILPATGGEVAGLATEWIEPESGEKISEVEFTIAANEWVKVRKTPDQSSQLLGYTRKMEGVAYGEEIWGKAFPGGEVTENQAGDKYGKWLAAQVYLWDLGQCEKENPDCEAGRYLIKRDDSNAQIQAAGYVAETDAITLLNIDQTTPSVLGLTTDETVTTSEIVDLEASEAGSVETTSEAAEFIEIASLSAQASVQDVKKITLSDSSIRQAIVNTAMLKMMGLTEDEAVGKSFQASFIVVGDLLGGAQDRLESLPAEYTILGVIPDDKTPVFYVPFLDLRQLEVVNYSQAKVVAHSQQDLDKVRKQIEAQGFVTRSVADTVSQINNLFATVRTVLLLIGMVALGVAALGMFNTLTVSLLERTHEVGLIKAMGMKSSEVRELFLTESMIMGFYGGFFGIAFGFLAGKLAGLFISIFSVVAGVGMIDIAYLPPSFLIAILVLSLVVGMVTGIYPAYRTTKISALNALRYE